MAVLKFAKKKRVKKTKVKSGVKRKIAKKKVVKKKIAKTKVAGVAKKKKPLPKGRVKKKTVRVKKIIPPQEGIVPKEEFVGEVTHYFPKVRVAVVKIAKAGLALGDKIHIKGHSSDFTQIVSSMQIEHTPIDKASKGDDIGLRVNSRARTNDSVYKL